MIWKTGQLIQRGKYVIEKILGAGGSGITYLARDTNTKNPVAIKTLNATIQAQSDFHKHQERFVQEAFKLALCNHNHVIKVNDVSMEDNLWLMVMEYIDGANFESLVKKKQKLSNPEAIRYISQIGNALAYIHERGILHRDVKPANIMYRTNQNEAVLIDFGLARDFVQDKTQIHTNSHTDGFAPIEQYERKAKRGAYSDVYALAATLYYFLTAKIPFPAPFRTEGSGLVTPQTHNPQISDQINYAILKGMELLPENRPQSVLNWLSLLTGETQTESREIMEKNQASIIDIPQIPANKPRKTQFTPLRLPRVPQTNPTKNSSIVSSQTSKSSIKGYDPFNPQRFKESSPSNNLEQQTKELSLPFIVEQITLQQPLIDPNKADKQENKEKLSEVGIDYTVLRDLLKAEKWEEADKITNELILKVSGKEILGWIDKEAMKKFPCLDLQTIDRLWFKYSGGRFGFSVQKSVYMGFGGKRVFDRKIWELTGDKIGWRVNGSWIFKENLIYAKDAPRGHLPSLAHTGLVDRVDILFSRAMDCNI